MGLAISSDRYLYQNYFFFPETSKNIEPVCCRNDSQVSFFAALFWLAVYYLELELAEKEKKLLVKNGTCGATPN